MAQNKTVISTQKFFPNRITLVGAGNLGWNLAFNFSEKGFPVTQIISRSLSSAQGLAEAFRISSFSDRLADLDPAADFVFLAVRDDVIEETALALSGFHKDRHFFLHSSGSVGLSALESLGGQIGVFYPLQTFSKNKPVSLENAPIFLETFEQKDFSALEVFAKQISSQVLPATSAERRNIHAGAVFASNFVNYMVYCADVIARRGSSADYRVYLPLIQEVAKKLEVLPPFDAQTGPAKRGDQKVIEAHLQILESLSPDLAPLYRQLTDGVQKMKPNLEK